MWLLAFLLYTSARAHPDGCDAVLATVFDRFEGVVNVVDRDGNREPVASYRLVQFKAELPRFRRAALATGLTEADARRLALTLVRAIRFEHMHPADELAKFSAALERVATRGIRLQGQAGRLTRMLLTLGKSDVTAYAFPNLARALGAGFTLEQTIHLMTKMRARGGVLSAYTLFALEGLFKTMALYHVDAATVFAGLDAVVGNDYGKSTYVDLAFIIERDVLELGRSANEFLSQLADVRDEEDLGDRFDARLATTAVPWSHGQSADFALANPPLPDYPRVSGRLRHSFYRYALDRDLQSGFRDLVDLGDDPECASEGAFVFDPWRGTWYSLGGDTEVDVGAGRVRQVFKNEDLARFGPRPIFVHLHPKSLDWVIRSPTDLPYLRPVREAFDRFLAATPSPADLRMFAKLTHEASSPVKPDFVIIHRLGATVVRLGEDQDAVTRLADEWRELRQWALTSHGTAELLGRSEGAVVRALLERLRRRLDDRVTIELYERPEDLP